MNFGMIVGSTSFFKRYNIVNTKDTRITPREEFTKRVAISTL